MLNVVMSDIEKSAYAHQLLLMTVLTSLIFSEIIHQIHEIHNKVRPESVELIRRDYTANGGWETFLSFEDPEKDILIGLLRLRKCSEEGTFRPELVATPEGGVSIVRELHVYGTSVPVHGRDPTKFQHQVCSSALGDVRENLVSTKTDESIVFPGFRDATYGGGGAYCS